VQEIAAVAVFLATKIEETCRKVKELVIACCRVAQKNPQLVVDENTKDFWRWKDTILLNEDVLLETLCFDLTVESPYKLMFDMIKRCGLHHDKALRNAAWSFLNDSNNTQLCLLHTTRTIAAAALYCAAKHTGAAFPDADDGRPWWEVQRVRLGEVRQAVNYMAKFYETSKGQLKAGDESIYVGLSIPEGKGREDEDADRTRLKGVLQTPLSPTVGVNGGGEMTPTTTTPAAIRGTRAGERVVGGRERSASEMSLGKRSRDDGGDEHVKAEGGLVPDGGEEGDGPDVKKEEALKANGTHVVEEEVRAAKRRKMDADAAAAADAADSREPTQGGRNGASVEEEEGSEEGEVEE